MKMLGILTALLFVVLLAVITGIIGSPVYGQTVANQTETNCVEGDNPHNARLIAGNIAYASDVLKSDKFSHVVPYIFGYGHIRMTVKQLFGRPSSTIEYLPVDDSYGAYYRAGTGTGYITQRWDQVSWTKAAPRDTYLGCILYERFAVMLFYQKAAE